MNTHTIFIYLLAIGTTVLLSIKNYGPIEEEFFSHCKETLRSGGHFAQSTRA